MEYTVEANSVSHSFGKNNVLCDINLKIGKGEIFGLLGPSGAGKTTLIRILTGQLRQTCGTATLLGKETAALSGADFKKIGTVMDNPGLYERLSCAQNLKIFAKIYGIDTARAAQALESVGLHEALKTPVMKLSKGMKGRLAFARASLACPEVLFLDEPTSGLDPATTRELHELIRQEAQRGVTIFLTTHNMTEAQSLCDRIALLSDGKIVEHGTPDDVCRKYDCEKKLIVRMKNGQTTELSNDRSAAEPLALMLEQGELMTIHSTEPDLESVFMQLTGRRFD